MDYEYLTKLPMSPLSPKKQKRKRLFRTRNTNIRYMNGENEYRIQEERRQRTPTKKRRLIATGINTIGGQTEETYTRGGYQQKNEQYNNNRYTNKYEDINLNQINNNRGTTITNCKNRNKQETTTTSTNNNTTEKQTRKSSTTTYELNKNKEEEEIQKVRRRRKQRKKIPPPNKISTTSFHETESPNTSQNELNTSTTSSNNSPYTDRFFPSRKASDLKHGFQSPPSPIRSKYKNHGNHIYRTITRSSDFSTVARMQDPSDLHPTNLFSTRSSFSSSLQQSQTSQNSRSIENTSSTDSIQLNMTYPTHYGNRTIDTNRGVVQTDHHGSTVELNNSQDETQNFAKSAGAYQEYLRSEFQYRENLFSYRNVNSHTSQRTNRLTLQSPTRNPQSPSTANNKKRKIPLSPIKLLDAPNLQDDFYLNLVDWGSSNMLSVALHDSVYLWNASTSKVLQLCTLEQKMITSVKWMENGNILAVGNSKGTVQLWDVTKSKCIRDFEGHKMRVGCLAWNQNVLASGSRDHNIIQRDLREPSHAITRLTSHKQEVCGLEWSPDGNYLASGGNDNKLLIWQPHHKSTPFMGFSDHRAAVKGISWSPHQYGLLASGGGTADRCIRFWNVVSGQALHYVDTGSQVCNIAWSENVNELVSTHGYSQNQIVVWDYPTMTPVTTLTGHSTRVLYLSMSPDGQTIVTGAGDETLRIWDVFPPAASTHVSSDSFNVSCVR